MMYFNDLTDHLYKGEIDEDYLISEIDRFKKDLSSQKAINNTLFALNAIKDLIDGGVVKEASLLTHYSKIKIGQDGSDNIDIEEMSRCEAFDKVVCLMIKCCADFGIALNKDIISRLKPGNLNSYLADLFGFKLQFPDEEGLLFGKTGDFTLNAGNKHLNTKIEEDQIEKNNNKEEVYSTYSDTKKKVGRKSYTFMEDLDMPDEDKKKYMDKLGKILEGHKKGGDGIKEIYSYEKLKDYKRLPSWKAFHNAFPEYEIEEKFYYAAKKDQGDKLYNNKHQK